MNISSLEKKDFDSLFEIMTQSFPPEEYRKKEKQYALLDDPKYKLTVLKEDNKISGFIAAWNLSDFIFIEHLAITPVKRNKGVGSAFVAQYLKESDLPIVLEVENKVDEISLRRINFYKRLGFVLTDICYNQPNFSDSDTVIPLKIMYYSKESFPTLSRVEETIFRDIYKK